MPLFGSNHELAAMGHGVPGIGRQVENRQFQLVDIGQHRRQCLGETGLDVY